MNANALKSLIGRMTPKPSAARLGPIGIEFALEKAHLVQLERGAGGHVALRASASVPFPGARDDLLRAPHALRKLLARGLAADRFKGRRAALAMPAGFFRTLSVTYQPAAGQSDESAIGALMRERLDGELTDWVIDFQPVRTRSRDGERLALVAVSRREQVIDYLEAMRMAGLHVGSLEVGPVAIRRLVSVMPSDGEADVVLVINTGSRTSFLTMIAGRRLLFDQEVKVGEESLLRELSRSLDMSPDMARNLVLRTGLHQGGRANRVIIALDETGVFNTLLEILKPQLQRLVEEIERAFMYVASETRGGAVTRVYLLGSVARWPGADAALSELAHVTVTNMPNPLTLFGDDAAFGDVTPDALAPELAVATGLALRGLCDGA